MRFTYNWLKDFVEIKLPPRELAGRLTMAGLEITSLQEKEGDCVFEAEVTPNRPDLLSVIGIAREIAAITNSKFRAYSVKRIAYRKPSLSAKRYPLNVKRFKIHIEDKKDCPLYTAKIIKNVKVGPSPEWLRKRLELAGCRSVNNIVDITNYILLSWGEPLHAFDLDKLVIPLSRNSVAPLGIIIRRAKKSEEIITIDGVKRILDENALIIAAQGKISTGNRKPATGRPVAVAGIMGGKESEVSAQTKDILLEAAVFSPLVVRRAKRQLGLESESAYRFERGVSPAIVEESSRQAALLIQRLAGGECVFSASSAPPPQKRKKIKFDPARCRQFLGENIENRKIKTILAALGFKVRGKKIFSVEALPQRPDICGEVDLIEEVARLFGYEKIPATLAALRPQLISSEERGLIRRAKLILAGLGLNEVITYSLVSKDSLLNLTAGAGIKEAIEIFNPLSREQEVLRPQLLPGICAALAYNLNQKEEEVGIFELGAVFLAGDGPFREEARLGIALCGVKTLSLEERVVKEPLGLATLKGLLRVFFERMGVGDYDFQLAQDGSAVKIFAGRRPAGRILKLSSAALKSLNIKNQRVFAAELSLPAVFAAICRQKRFIPLPKYPGVMRDISFVLREDISLEGVFAAMKEKGRPFLRDLSIADYYKGEQIPAGSRGLTVSCLYRADERTLTENEINPLHEQVCAVLRERFAAALR